MKKEELKHYAGLVNLEDGEHIISDEGGVVKVIFEMKGDIYEITDTLSPKTTRYNIFDVIKREHLYFCSAIVFIEFS